MKTKHNTDPSIIRNQKCNPARVIERHIRAGKTDAEIATITKNHINRVIGIRKAMERAAVEMVA